MDSDTDAVLREPPMAGDPMSVSVQPPWVRLTFENTAEFSVVALLDEAQIPPRVMALGMEMAWAVPICVQLMSSVE